MKYSKEGDLYVFETGGESFRLNIEQIGCLAKTLGAIRIVDRIAENQIYHCFVDDEDEETCVWDYGTPDDCEVARSGISKIDCEYWRKVGG